MTASDVRKPQPSKMVHRSRGQSVRRINERILGSHYEPNNYTVFSGRTKKHFESIGNLRFRILASIFLSSYREAASKVEKSNIVDKIVGMVREAGGDFVQKRGDVWWEIGDAAAREKTGALLRDCLSDKYASSAKAKTKRRAASRESKTTDWKFDEVDREASSLPSNDSTHIISNSCEYGEHAIDTISVPSDPIPNGYRSFDAFPIELTPLPINCLVLNEPVLMLQDSCSVGEVDFDIFGV